MVYNPQTAYGYYAPPAEEEDSLDPLKLIWYAIHYRWLIAALLTAGLVIGVLHTYLQTPFYRASTKVEIEAQGARVIQDLEVMTQSSGLRAFETAREKMQSRDLARRVAFALNLPLDQRFLAPTPSFSLINLVNRVTGARPTAELEKLSAEQREALAISKIRSGLSVELLRNTSILSVSYSHANPIYAAKVANQVVRSFTDQNVDKTSETSDLARQFIQEQVQETKQRLQISEKSLVDYAKQAGITLTGSDASLISENISELNRALSDAMQERLEANRYFDQVQAGNAEILPDVFASESIQSTKRKIIELNATYKEKLGTLKPDFPEMKRMQAQINELQREIQNEIGAIALSTKIKNEQAEEKVAALKRELALLEAAQSDFQDKNIQYTILKREVDSNRTQYETLISKLNEVGVGSELKTANAYIIETAVAPGAPYSPNLKKSLAFSLALFAAVAAMLIYVLELMRNTFTNPDQIKDELNLPVLGILPSQPDDEQLTIAMEDPKSPLSEAYRSLRTSLQFTGTGDAMQTLVVTSSQQGEGKSTTVYKLSQDFAALGRRVLVVDADLRKPRMHHLFKTNNAAGLSNILSNVLRQGDVSSILQKTKNPLITLLPAGTIPPNPVELLMSQKMADALRHMANTYDIVIIDSAPVLGLADAPVLCRMADATLLVVAAKQVTRKSAKNAVARLRHAGGNVVGAALNKFLIDKFDYNYSYRYMDYNYYGYENASIEIENHASSERGKKKTLTSRLARGGSDIADHFRRRLG